MSRLRRAISLKPCAWACIGANLAEAEIDAVFDESAYGLRHRVERFINKIKHYRHIAMLQEDGVQLLLDAPPRRRYDLAAR